MPILEPITTVRKQKRCKASLGRPESCVFLGMGGEINPPPQTMWTEGEGRECPVGKWGALSRNSGERSWVAHDTPPRHACQAGCGPWDRALVLESSHVDSFPPSVDLGPNLDLKHGLWGQTELNSHLKLAIYQPCRLLHDLREKPWQCLPGLGVHYPAVPRAPHFRGPCPVSPF